MTPTLSVARDALLEQATIADVLDLARTMALERLARGLPVAWVGARPGTAMPLAVWLVIAITPESSPALAEWHRDVWRDGRRYTSGGTTGGTATPIAWSLQSIHHYLTAAVAILDGDATRSAWGA